MQPLRPKYRNLKNQHREDQNNNRLKSSYDRDRRYGSEPRKKVMTFEDSHISRPSTFNQNVPLIDGLYYNNTTVNNDNSFSLRVVPTSMQIHQLNSIQTNDDNLSTELLLSNPKPNNPKEHRQNFTSAEMGKLNSVLNNDKDHSVSSELLQFESDQNYSKNNYRQQDTNEHNINLTTTDMLRYKQVQNDTSENNLEVCRLDLLRPLDTNINSNELVPGTFNEILNIPNFKQSITSDGNKVHDKGMDVSWNEMFDTALLPDIIAPLVKDKLIADQNSISNENSIKISFPKDIKSSKRANKCKKDKKTGKKIARPKKRKKDIPLIEENVPKKKLRENDEKQKRVKNESYKKSVEKWLDGVAITNPDEAETSNKTSDRTVTDTLVAKEQNPPKKIIQAQLKNKGGIMKFSKPDDQKEGNYDNATKGTAIDTVNKVAKKVTAKKNKPKFIAPLKSQVAVKEIEFQVVFVNETNWKEHFFKWQNFNITNIYAVLTYSNGFSQLNKQFTEDDCIPEGIMLLIDENEFYYFNKSKDKFSDIIVRFLENQTVVCIDGKDILIYFKHNFKLEVNIIIHDVKIGGSLLEPDSPPESFSDLQKLMSTNPDYRLATDCKLQKTAWYLTLLRDCAEQLKTKLLEQSLWKLFEDIEMKVLPIIADMEFRGVHVDTEMLKSMEATLLSRMKIVEAKCHQAAAKAFLVTSPAQVATILYDELQLHTKCNLLVKGTLNTGAKSTSEAMLRTLVPLHPLPGLILEYRRLHKAHATFLAGVGQHVKDGVIRPTWVQTAAATGRIAASNPNVQAIPKAPFSLSSDADNPEEALNLRAVYVARPGRLLLGADFRQVECRVLAAAAADAALLGALRAAGDLFTVLAAKWLNKSEQEVCGADRERTKRLVYARMYGAGTRKLMHILDCSYEQALSVQASFDRTFPSLKAFGAAVRAGARAPRTAAGRARPLRALRSADCAQRARAQRQALNFLVQGTAADICKVAMCSAHAQLRAAGVRARLLLQIHDELVWEVAHDQLDAAHAIIRSAMESSGRAAGLARLPVAAAAGRRWGRLRALDPDYGSRSGDPDPEYGSQSGDPNPDYGSQFGDPDPDYGSQS